MNECLVAVIVEDPRWNILETSMSSSIEQWIIPVCQETLKCVGFVPNIEFSLLLTDDTEIKSLNAHFRGKDQTTDVLSFPLLTREELVPLWSQNTSLALGDIALSFDTIYKEGSQFENHTCHLIIHSLLHLLGYDHIDPTEALDMESIEVRILNSFSIPNPYISL